MLKVYVAGAYSAPDVLGILQNIGKGEKFAAKLFINGFAPFCPWLDKSYAIHYPEYRYFSVEMFQKYSMVWLEASDCLITVPNNWEHSKGTKAEIERAKELNIPVFYELNDLIKYRNQLELIGGKID